MEKENKVIFDPKTIEFVTVAAETCGFLEKAEVLDRADFVDKLLKILPLLYLKAQLIPQCDYIQDTFLENFVTEETYEILRMNIAYNLAEKDDYLEVFLPDMQYSDTPLKKCISEDLADIYQDLKDFIHIFQFGINETMNDALVRCKQSFETFWGQRLVNTLRALHNIKYDTTNSNTNEDLFESELDYRADTELF